MIKEFAGNTPKKIKVYIMPVGIDKEVETAVEYIGGKLHLPPATHEALGFDCLTLN